MVGNIKMKKILKATIMVALVLTMYGINTQGIAFGQSDSDSNTAGRQMLCYGAGIIMALNGQLSYALTLGRIAHAEGICP